MPCQIRPASPQFGRNRDALGRNSLNPGEPGQNWTQFGRTRPNLTEYVKAMDDIMSNLAEFAQISPSPGPALPEIGRCSAAIPSLQPLLRHNCPNACRIRPKSAKVGRTGRYFRHASNGLNHTTLSRNRPRLVDPGSKLAELGPIPTECAQIWPNPTKTPPTSGQIRHKLCVFGRIRATIGRMRRSSRRVRPNADRKTNAFAKWGTSVPSAWRGGALQ